MRSAARRGYTVAWRKAFLRDEQLLCQERLKEGRYTKATVVDNIVPHRDDSKLFRDKIKWQGLRKHHHNVKTMTKERNKEYRY